MLSTISEMDPVLIAAAVIPAVILLLQVYRADRLEKEPTGLLISLLVFGVIATALAIVTETIGENILLSFFDETDLGYLILSNFIVVALSEEGFKLLLLRWRTWRSPNFNCQFDGVVYAVFVSLGFALWENIGYVAMYGFGTALVLRRFHGHMVRRGAALRERGRFYRRARVPPPGAVAARADPRHVRLYRLARL